MTVQEAAAIVEGAAQAWERTGDTATADQLRHALCVLLGIDPEQVEPVPLPPADEETQRIVAKAFERFKAGTH